MNNPLTIRIIGNGLAATVAALGLAQQGHHISIDPPLPTAADNASSSFERPLALADSSLRILAQLLGESLASLLTQVNATAIQSIHVSEQGHVNRLKLRANEFSLSQFGAVVSANRLLSLTTAAIQTQRNITIVNDTPTAEVAAPSALTIIANGAYSPEREALGFDMVTQPYRESALTGLIGVSTPQPNVAFERFSADGPLALLPFGDQYAYVLTVDNTVLADFPISGDDATNQIAQRIEDRLGKRLGTITDIQPQARFPLTLRYADRLTTDDTVLLGNTALSIHPIAGQGYNLVVRDIAWLMEYLSPDQLIAKSLADYAQERRRDHQITRHFTHSMVTLFDQPWLWLPRGLGLGIANWSPPLQRLFMDIGGGQLTRQSKLRFGINP